MNTPIGLAAYRWNSNRKSLFLIGLYPVITLILFWVQIFLFLMVTTHYPVAMAVPITTAFFLDWSWVLLLALCGWLYYSWHNYASIIRGFCTGHPVTADEEPRLYAILESICISQGIQTPDLEIIEHHARNSFVCAVDDDTYRLFITRGLLEALQEDEIEAVIAHEIAHILHGDTKLLSLSIAFCDLFPALSASRLHMKDASTKENIEAQASAVIALLNPIILALLMPLWGGYIATSLIRVSLFINREFDADASAYEITKNADALMRALIRISRRALMPTLARDIRFLCIGNPKGGFFATHPRLSRRLEMISMISGTPIPETEESSMAPVHRRFRESPLHKRTFKHPGDKPPAGGYM